MWSIKIFHAVKIISSYQSGFHPHHSTETILLDSTNEWLKNMDKGFMNGVLFLDTCKTKYEFPLKSFSYRAAKSWNNLPLTLTQNIGDQTANVFKTLLITHYRNNYGD